MILVVYKKNLFKFTKKIIYLDENLLEIKQFDPVLVNGISIILV